MTDRIQTGLTPDELVAEERKRTAAAKAAAAEHLKSAIEHIDVAIRHCIAEGKRLDSASAANSNRLNALRGRLAALDVVRISESLF